MSSAGYRNLASHPTVKRLYRFVAVGTSAALVQTVLLWALVEGGSLNYLYAAVFAIELTIVLQFVANNAWTFQSVQYTSRTDFLVGLLRTNVVRGTAIPLQVGLLYVFVKWAGLLYLLANGAAIFLSGIYRYYLDSRWTWKVA